MKTNTIQALLKAQEKGNGYYLSVLDVKVCKGIVQIKMNSPERTVVLSLETYDKIKHLLKTEVEK